MRRCVSCDELTNSFEAECRFCHYRDMAWIEALEAKRHMAAKPSFSHATKPQFLQINSSAQSPQMVVIPISSSSDSAELAYELSRVRVIAEEGTGFRNIEIRFDFIPLGFAWNLAGVEEDFDFVPAHVGILALTEAYRAIQTAQRDFGGARISAVLPPEEHPASSLLMEAGLLSSLPRSDVLRGGEPMRQEFANMRALDLETIVPFTHVGSSTFGQLSDRFHARFDTFFDAFVERGDIAEKWRTPLRQVVMALAENGSEYGRGCSIGCFLRQEKGHAANSRERTDDVLFDPRRHTHLFINCFTLGPSLAEVTGHPTEWEAAQAVLGGFTVRQQGGGGSGMHNVMHTVVQSAKGTVYINSKNYVRMVLPDGLVREHTFGGDLYLPGVHICLLIPLAVIAELSQRKAV